MKKLFALGAALMMAIMLQPNLFAMKKQSQIQIEANIKKAFREKPVNENKVEALLQQLSASNRNKKYWQEELAKLKKSRNQATMTLEEETVTRNVNAPGAKLQTGTMVTEETTVEVLPATPDVKAALEAYKEAKIIADALAGADFTKSSNDASVSTAINALKINSSPQAADFAKAVYNVLEMRRINNDINDPKKSVVPLEKIEAAFNAGKVWFYDEVGKLLDSNNPASMYSPAKAGKMIPVNDPGLLTQYAMLKSIKPNDKELKTSLNDYYNSTLIEIFRSMQILWRMFDNDWRAKATNDPWPAFQNAKWDQMEGDLNLMRAIAVAAFYLVGAEAGATKNLKDWSDAKTTLDKLFFLQIGALVDVKVDLQKEMKKDAAKSLPQLMQDEINDALKNLN